MLIGRAPCCTFTRLVYDFWMIVLVWDAENEDIGLSDEWLGVYSVVGSRINIYGCLQRDNDTSSRKHMTPTLQHVYRRASPICQVASNDHICAPESSGICTSMTYLVLVSLRMARIVG